MSVISVSGKLGSGKDTVGAIIQYLTSGLENSDIDFYEFLNTYPNLPKFYTGSWKIKKFADKLKDIVCLLIGCTREQLEDRIFKETPLSEDWTVYYIESDVPGTHRKQIFSSRETAQAEADRMPFDREVVSEILTPRKILQLLGTDAGRDIIHPQIWVNSLFSDYKPAVTYSMQIVDFSENAAPPVNVGKPIHDEYPDWIITDARFPNELDVVKQKGGLTIRVTRDFYKYDEVENQHIWSDEADGSGDTAIVMGENSSREQAFKVFMNAFAYRRENEHESEKAIDTADYDYIIDNTGTLEQLKEKVREILIKEKLL